ncbi:MAG: hypothetical protein GXP45_00665 [bacterium]|nr:hypothetical protein [bacterium]
MEILSHEAGHITDLGIIQGTKRQLSPTYTEFGKKRFAIDDPSLWYYEISFTSEKTRNANAQKEDFCSRYGMTDPFEDFAECYNLYINHHNIFQTMAKNNTALQKKYLIIDHILQHQYLQDDTKNYYRIQQNPQWRVWDTTKMK